MSVGLMLMYAAILATLFVVLAFKIGKVIGFRECMRLHVQPTQQANQLWMCKLMGDVGSQAAPYEKKL